MSAEVRRAAVLGSPIAHSLSPVLHRAAYAELGLAWQYDAVECTEAALPAWVRGLDGSWAGLSLTMPLKRAVLPLLDSRTELVDTVGAANTVVVSNGRLHGDNTDVHGVAAALGEGAVGAPSSATLIGGGATAASALAALAGLAVTDVTVVARSAARCEVVFAVASRLGVTLTVDPWPGSPDAWGADVVIATVPAGATDAVAPSLPGVPRLLLDVVYAPWPTPLAAAVAAGRGDVVGGLAVLVHQAALQVELMTGRPAPLAAMRVAGEQALRDRAR